jgi:hypothetical protein
LFAFDINARWPWLAASYACIVRCLLASAFLRCRTRLECNSMRSSLEFRSVIRSRRVDLLIVGLCVAVVCLCCFPRVALLSSLFSACCCVSSRQFYFVAQGRLLVLQFVISSGIMRHHGSLSCAAVFSPSAFVPCYFSSLLSLLAPGRFATATPSVASSGSSSRRHTVTSTGRSCLSKMF